VGVVVSDLDLTLSTSRHFVPWLQRHRVSLGFTTYQAGKVFLIGVQPSGRLSVFERTFSRCMGMWADGQTIWMSSLFQLWRFENQLEPGVTHDGYDAVYTPMAGHTTGDLDVHDLAVTGDGQVVFVNTLFNCLATLSRTRSFTPVWRPGFISELVPEDRCHLNGLALRDGQPRYVTAVAGSDVVDGWRDRRTDGGVVIDVATGEVVCAGLSMPHSPRWHNGRLWLLESGTGYLGYVEDGAFRRVTFLPGYARGLAIVDNYAVVGLSRPRETSTFSGLALDGELGRRDAEPRCGVHVIDLATGATAEWLRIDGVVQELYDVVALPGVVRPMVIGFQTDEIQRSISIDDG
jgi:uncharacterized protein (TIGR03032 family)